MSWEVIKPVPFPVWSKILKLILPPHRTEQSKISKVDHGQDLKLQKQHLLRRDWSKMEQQF